MKFINNCLFLSLVIMVFFLFTCGAGLAADSNHGSTSLPNQVEAIEEALIISLSDEKNWTDKNRREELRDLFAVASRLRSPKLVPILMRHLTFEPGPTFQRGNLIDYQFPVSRILIEIGLPSVRMILERLKMIDPTEETSYAHDAPYILVYSLLKIYDQGGDGKKLARLRLELELANSSGEAKSRLQEISKDSWLKD